MAMKSRYVDWNNQVKSKEFIMSDFTKTQRVLCLIRALISAPNNMINDKTFRDLMGKPSKAQYHKLINEFTNDQAEIRALLIRIEEEDDFLYTLNECYSGFASAGSQFEFVLECYSRLGSVLPEEMQKRLSYIVNQKTRRSKKLSRKFCLLAPVKGRELETPQKNVLTVITKAILEEKEIKITYSDSQNTQTTFLYKPFTLCQYREDLYLLGEELSQGEYSFKTCKIRRILQVEASETKFSYPVNWNPQNEFRLNSGIINKRDERYDVQIKVFGVSRITFKEKNIFNNKLIINEAEYDIYELTCTSINEFIGQLFVYAQDVEIIDNEMIKNKFIEKAEVAISRNKKIKKVA